MDKLVSIIIRTYNEQKHVDKLLRSIFEQNFSKEKLQVIIVDSGSTDSTLEYARKYPVELLHIRPEDFTFGYSLNRGIEHAKGDYIIMISAHCHPMDKDWISNLIKPFEKDQKIGVVYGKQRGKDTSKYSEHQIFKTWFPEKADSRQNTPFCNNANCAIKKSLWEKHRYNEKLTGLEDLEWAKEIIKMGYLVYYQPEAGIYHIHNETYSQVYNRYRREAIAIKNIYPDLKFSFFEFIRLLFSNIFIDILNSIKDKSLFDNFTSIIAFRFFQFWGTYRGHRFNKEVAAELKKRFYYPAK
ncbi:MAG TPA: glycosyltransferase [Bacillota bacterium]|nr:glycosyltransferase [Bacillota bacterium]